MTADDVAALLRAKREAAGVEREVIAQVAGVSVHTVKAWELGTSGVETVAAYLTALEACGVVIVVRSDRG